jgi:hypothetical protein
VLAALKAFCSTASPLDRAETVDAKRRNRHERRVIETFPISTEDAKSLPLGRSGLIAAVIRISRITLIKATKTSLWGKRAEMSCHASQIDLPARRAAVIIPAHWAIENQNHYVRHVPLAEDRSRIRTKPLQIARLRSFALDIMRANAVSNIATETDRNSLDAERFFAYPVS